MTAPSPGPAVSARRTSAPVAGSDFTYAVLPDPPKPQSMGAVGDRRAGARQRTRLRSGKIVDGSGRFLTECLIANRSSIGGLLRLARTAMLPARILLFDDQSGEVLPAAVVWRRTGEAGVRFLPPDPSEHHRAVADAMRRKFYAMGR